MALSLLQTRESSDVSRKKTLHVYVLRLKVAVLIQKLQCLVTIFTLKSEEKLEFFAKIDMKNCGFMRKIDVR